MTGDLLTPFQEQQRSMVRRLTASAGGDSEDEVSSRIDLARIAEADQDGSDRGETFASVAGAGTP